MCLLEYTVFVAAWLAIVGLSLNFLAYISELADISLYCLDRAEPWG